MSYSGSVHCGWCGQKGHNKRSCQARAESAARNPDGYSARALAREKERNKSNNKRSCSYCHGEGHNRRSCNQIKNDKAVLLYDTKRYRERFLKSVQKHGVGPGALILEYFEKRHDCPIVHMVIGIDWDYIGPNMEEGYGLSCQRRIFQTILANVNLPDDFSPGRYWRVIPKVGSRCTFGAHGMAGIMDDVFNNDNEYEFPPSVMARKESVSPPAGWLNPQEIPELILAEWGISPPAGSNAYDKQRNEYLWAQRNKRVETHAEIHRKEENNIGDSK